MGSKTFRHLVNHKTAPETAFKISSCDKKGHPKKVFKTDALDRDPVNCYNAICSYYGISEQVLSGVLKLYSLASSCFLFLFPRSCHRLLDLVSLGVDGEETQSLQGHLVTF